MINGTTGTKDSMAIPVVIQPLLFTIITGAATGPAAVIHVPRLLDALAGTGITKTESARGARRRAEKQ